MHLKTGRNDSCPCGSGRKYKKCCLGNEKVDPAGDPIRSLIPSSLLSGQRNLDLADDFALRDLPTPRPRTEWDDWNDRYDSCSLPGKLDMLRALLAEDHPPEFYTKMGFFDALSDADRNLSDEEYITYIAFLEELRATRADVFALDAQWLVRDMVYAYVTGGRPGEVAQVLEPLLGADDDPHEAVFDLLDFLRLAGLDPETRSLVMAMCRRIESGVYTPWAARELIETAAYFFYRDAIEMGSGPDAVDQLMQQFNQIGCQPERDRVCTMLQHRAGTADRRFELQELIGRPEKAGFNLYLLTLDFGRWLTQQNLMPPVVAESARHFVHDCLFDMWPDRSRNPLVIHETPLDRYLARKANPLSLQQLRAVATVVALGHFYDFLRSVDLVDERERARAKRITEPMLNQLLRFLGQRSRDYEFLQKYH
jgi:hypothetical protein